MELTHDTLCQIWFVLLGVLMTGYAILDGFDLGVGILHLAARDDRERRVLMNSIGPLWDGNEVWLVTFGGAMFAAFPHAYATIFSGFYIAFMALLLALIFRAVSLEFRGKTASPTWRRIWDVGFFAGSLLATFLFGVAVGNAMIGMPIGPDMEFAGSFTDLLRPYPLLVGCFTVAMFAMHGAIYLYLKTEGQLQERIGSWMWHTFGAFLVLYLMTTIFTLANIPSATRNFADHPWAWVVVVLNVLAIANIPRAIYLGRPGYAFVSSCCTIAAFIFLFSIALSPNLVASSLSPEYSLTIYNAASSARTLTIMLIIAIIGMPFVLAYTGVIYWLFRGKVQLGEHSY
ncbi:MAG: cytochrome d ubiquinol oxidase subunit II [Phycisphaerae bacterium]|nr:cytochrome d ubiquinol oxidase subunit II [Phycisphaerae bacterium]